MPVDGNSSGGTQAGGWSGEWRADLAEVQERVEGLAASRTTRETVQNRGIAPEPLEEALRHYRKHDTVTLNIDGINVIAVMSRDGTRKRDLIGEGEAWSGILTAFDEASRDVENDAHQRAWWNAPLASGVALIAWHATSGRRVVVHGPESSRLARRAAVAALAKRAVIVAIALLGWRLIRRGAQHGTAAMSGAALVAAVAALTVATTVPVSDPGAGDAPPIPGIVNTSTSAPNRSPRDGPSKTPPPTRSSRTPRAPTPGVPAPAGHSKSAPPSGHASDQKTHPPAPVAPRTPPRPPSTPAPEAASPAHADSCTLGLLGICVLPGH